MATGIELKQAQTRKSKQDWRLDPTRVVISAFLAGAAILGAAAGVLGFKLGQSSPQSLPPQIIYLQPAPAAPPAPAR